MASGISASCAISCTVRLPEIGCRNSPIRPTQIWTEVQTKFVSDFWTVELDMAALRAVLVACLCLVATVEAGSFQTTTLDSVRTSSSASRQISGPLLVRLRGGTGAAEAVETEENAGQDHRAVTFRRVPHKLSSSETLFVSGDCEALGNGDAAKAVQMKLDKVPPPLRFPGLGRGPSSVQHIQ